MRDALLGSRRRGKVPAGSRPVPRRCTRRRTPVLLLAALAIGVAGGCGLFSEPIRVDDPAKDLWVRVRNQRGAAFRAVESVGKGAGPFDVRIVMKNGWPDNKPKDREADVLTLARAWVGIILPVKPEVAKLEFVDSGGRVLAWGLFQTEKGLVVGQGGGGSK